MDPWLDSLSEDWISQPRSSSPSLPHGTSGLSDNSSFASNNAKSRLPRRLPRRRSTSAAHPTTHDASAALGELEGRRLKPISGNRNTSSGQRAGSRASKKGTETLGDSSVEGRGRAVLRTISSSKARTTQVYRTVQHKSFSSSPPKDRRRCDTPEWKRRLLGADGACVDKRDLFGPIPLENIFQPPPKTAAPMSRALPVRLNNHIPSSPPSFMGHQRSDVSLPHLSNTSSYKRSSATSSRQAEASAPHRRADSGLSSDEQRNEEISPIMVTRHGTVDTRADPPLMSLDENGQDGPEDGEGARETSARESQTDASRSRYPSRDQQRSATDGSSASAVSNESSSSTRDFISQGGFINFRRGGHSHEGSFRERDLSAATLPATTQDFSLVQEDSFDEGTPERLHVGRTFGHSAQKPPTVPPAAPTPPRAPTTPTKLSPRQRREPGSPLKLFGDHDTFTENKLLRTMNQWEQSIYQGNTDEDEKSHDRAGDADEQDGREREVLRERARIASFGNSELDGYVFENGDHPTTFGSGHFQDASSRVGSRKKSDVDGSSVSRRSGREHSSQHPPTMSSIVRHSSANEAFLEGHSRTQDAHEAQGKRPPASPGKDRSFKRRRTLNNSDVQGIRDHNDSPELLEPAHTQLSPVIGKKRKESRYYADAQEPDPEVLAMRRILRARIPSRASKSGRRSSLAVFDDPQAVPNGERLRKPSPTTQDFFDDALRAMEMIRANGKLHSGLASLDESESDGNSGRTFGPGSARGRGLRSGTQERASSIDEFSRPPSREGGNKYLPPLNPQSQSNPRVLSHLKKYAETSTSDGLGTSSLRSIGLPRGTTLPDGSRRLGTSRSAESNVESDLPSIRITENPELQQQDGRSTGSVDSHRQPGAQTGSQNSNPSSGTSSGRTDLDGSSGRSTRHVIAPETVSHLISGEVAGMTLDHTTQTWVRRAKAQPAPGAARQTAVSPSSDDDPLGNIPDLPVDPTAEALRVKAVAARAHANAMERAYLEKSELREDEPPVVPASTSGPAYLQPPSSRPTTREGSDQDKSCTPSKLSHLTSTGPRPETRATSWGTEPPAPFSKHAREETVAHASAPTPGDVDLHEDVEHEIRVNEGRSPDDRLPRAEARRGRRDVTITFSSPVVSQVIAASAEDSINQDSDISWPDDTQFRFDESDFERSWQQETHGLTQPGGRARPTRLTSRSYYRGTTRRMSFGGRSFSVRQCPPIDEQNEDSPDHPSPGVDRRVSMDVTVCTPVPVGRAQSLPTNQQVAKGETRMMSMSFHLSPLADFTMHPGDEREAEIMAARLAHPATRRSEVAPCNALSTIVRVLTDVEPLEPYWEDLQQLDLRGRGLTTLHDLEHFCGRVEEFDASDNELDQLGGAPSSLRHLVAANNRLTSLTAWGHLTNLQYLDISGNGITSLDALKPLMHLRELRADDNKLTSLDGLFALDGLTVLRARRNRLTSIEFETADLRRLSDLDLRSNQLTRASNLHHLPSLTHLDLGSNRLSCFAPPSTLPNLQSLTLPKNELATISLQPFPSLRLLYLDENHLASIHHLDRLRHLAVLSVRDQHSVATSPALHPPPSLRKLYLSGLPPHPSFLTPPSSPITAYPALQTLELASTSLTALPANFSTLFPALRNLNLAFNALKSLHPLRHHSHLAKLQVPGNRLARLRRTVADLSTLERLRSVDMRANPVTVGFYAPVVVRRAETSERERGTYGLPLEETQRDERFRARLDAETGLRRRVYECLLAEGCGALRGVDGRVFGGAGNDERMQERGWLREMGVLKREEASGEEDGDGDGEGNGAEERGSA